MTLFHIESAESDGTHRLRLHGEFDLAACSEAERALTQAIQAHQRVEVDLRELTFIDSSGCRALALAAKQARTETISFEIIPGPRVVQRVFEITKLDEVLPFRSEHGDGLGSSIVEDAISE